MKTGGLWYSVDWKMTRMMHDYVMANYNSVGGLSATGFGHGLVSGTHRRGRAGGHSTGDEH
jgi:hypothetical protein